VSVKGNLDGQLQIRKADRPPCRLYLQRPLRTLKEAERDSDASAHHPMSLPSPPESPAPSPPASRVHQDAARPIYLAIIAL